jgi:hypothetical protein
MFVRDGTSMIYARLFLALMTVWQSTKSLITHAVSLGFFLSQVCDTQSGKDGSSLLPIYVSNICSFFTIHQGHNIFLLQRCEYLCLSDVTEIDDHLLIELNLVHTGVFFLTQCSSRHVYEQYHAVPMNIARPVMPMNSTISCP